MEILETLLRWLHVLAGIVWIGHLYFFNFVNGPFQGKMDGDTKKKVNPELLPRALYFFRWGAAWTWITGVLLLGIVFHSNLSLLAVDAKPTPLTWILSLAAFLMTFAYEAILKSPLAKTTPPAPPRNAYIVCFLVIAAMLFLFGRVGNMTYRATQIHMGVMLGTIMAFNVWFRIWPAQQKIITAVKNGTPPDAALVGMAGARSRHNTYMSVPLLWFMLNQHTTMGAGGKFGLGSVESEVVALVVVAIAWHLVWQIYKKAGKVPGF